MHILLEKKATVWQIAEKGSQMTYSKAQMVGVQADTGMWKVHLLWNLCLSSTMRSLGASAVEGHTSCPPAKMHRSAIATLLLAGNRGREERMREGLSGIRWMEQRIRVGWTSLRKNTNRYSAALARNMATHVHSVSRNVRRVGAPSTVSRIVPWAWQPGRRLQTISHHSNALQIQTNAKFMFAMKQQHMPPPQIPLLLLQSWTKRPNLSKARQTSVCHGFSNCDVSFRPQLWTCCSLKASK